MYRKESYLEYSPGYMLKTSSAENKQWSNSPSSVYEYVIKILVLVNENIFLIWYLQLCLTHNKLCIGWINGELILSILTGSWFWKISLQILINRIIWARARGMAYGLLRSTSSLQLRRLVLHLLLRIRGVVSSLVTQALISMGWILLPSIQSPAYSTLSQANIAFTLSVILEVEAELQPVTSFLWLNMI